MRDKVLRWCRENAMLSPGQTVVCAVSGGADSVAMLHILCSLREALGVTVSAAHFNHRLRGAESDRDEAFVRKLCADWGVPLAAASGDAAARAGNRRIFGRGRAEFALRFFSPPSVRPSPPRTPQTTIWRRCC